MFVVDVVLHLAWVFCLSDIMRWVIIHPATPIRVNHSDGKWPLPKTGQRYDSDGLKGRRFDADVMAVVLKLGEGDDDDGWRSKKIMAAVSIWSMKFLGTPDPWPLKHLSSRFTVCSEKNAANQERSDFSRNFVC